MVSEITLATKTIQAENTPQKSPADSLRIHPVWKYRGPACTINFEWSVGQWWAGTYDRITSEYTATINQIASEEWQEFEPTIALPSIPLDKLSPREEPYIAEMWFRGPFPDLCVRVENCVRIIGVELETLEVDITPEGAGYVTTEPPPLDRVNYFTHNDTGQFEHGTRVRVEAHPNFGYAFDHWSDEIQGGVSYNNPEWVAGVMDEHKAVKAHFREEAPPVAEGTFTVFLKEEPISYEEFCVEWETTEGIRYLGTWAIYYLLIKEGSFVADEYGRPISLTGRLWAHLWDGAELHSYGPSPYYTLKHSQEYTFNLSDLILYER